MKLISEIESATYNPHENLCKTFVEFLTCSIEQYLSRYDNISIIGDFNTEVDNSSMENFLLNFDLASLLKDPTCFKNPFTMNIYVYQKSKQPRLVVTLSRPFHLESAGEKESTY